MPFWKQSEDPWDQKPEKHREPREEKAPQANPLDSLKQWNEERKAKAREKEEAKRLPPEKCPWCGKEMEQGFILGGRDAVRWYPGVYKFDLIRGLDGNAMDLLDDYSTWSCYKTVWLCRDCKKMVLNMPHPPETPDQFAQHMEDRRSQNTQEEETSDE
nr:PF20097 family protein [uncultured Oscillibacter sp.]